MGRRGNGEGCIYQRADGRWEASVSVGWHDDPDRPGQRKRKRKSIYGKTRKEVAEKLKVVLRDQQQGMNIAPERLTLEQYLERWLCDVVAPERRPMTLRTYRVLTSAHLIPVLGRVELQKLTAQQIHGLLRAKAAEGLAASTIGLLLTILRSALKQATTWELVPRNVAELVAPPQLSRYAAAVLTPEQARQFLEVARGHRLEALFTVGLAIGLRIGEALALHWTDVDLEQGTIEVKYTLQRLDGRYVFGAPKSEHSKRIIVLPDVVIHVLRRHRLLQLQHALTRGPRWQDHGLVFTANTGGPLNEHVAREQLKQLLRAAGLGDRRFHDLRHSCASILLAQGVPLPAIQKLLGHSSITITSKHYAHVLRELERRTAATMDQLLAATG